MNLSAKYLLDTNVAIAFFAGDLSVQEKVRNTEYIVAVPPVIGELCFGAQKSNRVTENLHKIDILVQQSIVFLVIWKRHSGTESSKNSCEGKVDLSRIMISGSPQLPGNTT